MKLDMELPRRIWCIVEISLARSQAVESFLCLSQLKTVTRLDAEDGYVFVSSVWTYQTTLLEQHFAKCLNVPM